MTRLNRRRLLATSGAVTVTVAALVAGSALFREGFQELPPMPVFAIEGLAIRGTDPVAYFTEGRTVPGDAAFAMKWNGATWRFASAGNRDAFAVDPERFAPRYGGFCAWAVAEKGKLYSTQPRNWSIVENRLYLNFNDEIQHRWQGDIPGFIARADIRWPEIVRGV
ncbi:YHS domain protein [Maritimibacter sp. 55A14]|nr:YHS domain protein [Maritimibacter sp. 55A14]